MPPKAVGCLDEEQRNPPNIESRVTRVPTSGKNETDHHSGGRRKGRSREDATLRQSCDGAERSGASDHRSRLGLRRVEFAFVSRAIQRTSRILKIDHESAKTVDEIFRQYRPHVVFNMGEHPDELRLAEKISKGLGQVSSIEVDYLGFVFREPLIVESLRKGTPLVPYQQQGRFSQNIRKIASRITKHWNTPIDNSAELLLKSTQADYQRWRADTD